VVLAGGAAARRLAPVRLRSRCCVVLRLLVGVALWGAPEPAGAQQAESWATSGARGLVAQGDAEAAAGRGDQAAKRYLEAIALDGSYGPAYLGLGAMRERGGDPKEAELVYTAGLERVVGFWQASLARARLRRRLGRREEAKEDLALAARGKGNDLQLIEELASWQIEDGRFVQALAIYRRLRFFLEEANDPAALARAELRIRALRVLAAEQDLLQARHAGAGWTRRAIEAIARKAGM
jgi:tetratricopeptide (TPR) repeat protein